MRGSHSHMQCQPDLIPDVQAVPRGEVEVGLKTGHADALVAHIQPRIAAAIEHCHIFIEPYI